MNYKDGWQKRRAEEIMTAFGTDRDGGLDPGTVRGNYKRWGKNSLWNFGNLFMFLKNESGFSVLGYAILAISAFAASAFEICDDAVLIGITIVVGILAFCVFEIIAGIVCSSYTEKWIPYCTVVRGGKNLRVRADSLVPGDIVVLKEGDMVCADVKLISSDNITVKEPPFMKKQGSVAKVALGNAVVSEGAEIPEDYIYAGAEILSGTGKAVVCATGARSVLGQKGKFRLTPDAEPVNLAVARKRSSVLGTVFMIFSFAAVAIGVFSPLSGMDFVGLFLVVLAFAVSAGGEIYTSLCCIMYTIALVRSKEYGVTVRDAAGVDFIMNCRSIAAENASLMKSGDVKLKLIFSGAGSIDAGNSEGDELFSILYAGTAYGKGKYSREIMGALEEHVSVNGDAERFISGVQTTKPIVDHEVSGHVQHALYVSGGEHYFAMIGSIDDVIRHCTKIRIAGRDVPMDKSHIKTILSAASEVSKNATYLICAAVRKSPYNSLKRLSVLTADLTFTGFIAVDAPADESIPAELAYLKSENIPFVLFSDGSGEDVNFARRIGVISKRSDLVSAAEPDNVVKQLMAENGIGGMVEADGEKMAAGVLAAAAKQGRRPVFVGHASDTKIPGFFVAIGDPVTSAGAVVKTDGKSEVAAFLKAHRTLRELFSGFGVAGRFILGSTILRGIYALSALFGSSYVYPSVILIWGIVFDVAVAALILFARSRRKASK